MEKYPSAHLGKIQVRVGCEDPCCEVLSHLTYKCAAAAGLAQPGGKISSTNVAYAEKIRLSVGKGTTCLSPLIMVGLRWS